MEQNNLSINQIIEQNQESDLSRSIQNNNITQNSSQQLQDNKQINGNTLKSENQIEQKLMISPDKMSENNIQNNNENYSNYHGKHQLSQNSNIQVKNNSKSNNNNDSQHQNFAATDPNSHNNSNSQYSAQQLIKPNYNFSQSKLQQQQQYQQQLQQQMNYPQQPSNNQALQILRPQIRPQIQGQLQQEQIEEQIELERLQKLQIQQKQLQKSGTDKKNYNFKQSTIPIELLKEQKLQLQMRSQSQGVLKKPIVSYNAEIIFDPQPSASDMYMQIVKSKLGDKKNNQQISGLLQKQENKISQQFYQVSNQKSSMSNNLQRQQNSLKKEEINFQTIKQIPFVNQDKDNFFQDIVHRKMYYGNLQSENGTQKFQSELVKLQKGPPKKKRRRHKTQFKMVKSNKNIKNIQQVCLDYIQQNRKLVNNEIIKVPQYEKSAPFLPSTLEFADQLIESKEQFKEKYGFEEKNLIRNKCLLETVVLSRLDQKQRQKSKIKMQKKPLTIREIQNEEELARLLEKQNQKSFEENQKLIEEMNQHQIQQLQQQYLELQQNIENDLQNGIKGKIQTQYKYNKQGLKKLEEDFKQRRTQLQQEFNKSRTGNQSFPKIQNNYNGKI